MKARAAPRCRPSWPRPGRRQGGRPGLERRAQRHALRRRLRHSVQRPQPRPGRSRSGQRQDRRPGVERRTQRHAVLRRLSRRMSHRRAPPASPATNNPPRVVFRRPRFRGGIFCPAASAPPAKESREHGPVPGRCRTIAVLHYPGAHLEIHPRSRLGGARPRPGSGRRGHARRDAQPCADHADPQGRPALVPPGGRRRAEQLRRRPGTNWSSVPKRKVTPPITVKLTPTQTTKLRTIAPAASWKAISRGPTPPSPGSSGSASSPTAAGRPAATKAGRAARASRGTGPVNDKTPPGPQTGRRFLYR